MTHKISSFLLKWFRGMPLLWGLFAWIGLAPAWPSLAVQSPPPSLVLDVLFVGKGLVGTLMLSACGLVMGSVLAVGMTVCRLMGILPGVWTGLISIIRGTPLLLQLALVYYTVPVLTGLRPSVLAAGVLAFGLNSSAYLAQTLQGGVEAIPKGQFEAAQSLGIPRFALWRDILMPQLIRIVQPSLINEMIALLKETALISILGGGDLMNQANILAAERFSFFRPLCIAALYYYALVLTIEALGRMLERKTKMRWAP
jgi:polar amino acid transport system permease protein